MRHIPTILILLALTLVVSISPAWSQSLGMHKPPREQKWGLGIMTRNTNVPFAEGDEEVSTLIPLIMFENKRFFFREIEGGLKMFRLGSLEFSALGRIHFFDLPEQYQNEFHGTTMDWGLQMRFYPDEEVSFDLELLSDRDRHVSAVARLTNTVDRDKWYFTSWLFAQYSTSQYNSYFWGLNREEIDEGIALGGGLRGHYHLISSFYLTGAVKATYLDSAVRSSSLVNEDLKWETFLGVGVSDPKDNPRRVRLPENAYLRLAHCWATTSSLAEIFSFKAEPDPNNNQLSTIFYGHPMSDHLFGLPIDVYLHTGFGWHWKSEVQDSTQEFILSIKLYYTIPLPVRVRLGWAEGISWVADIPQRERENLEEKGYTPSQLLNYMDPSIDINLGDILPGDALDGLWFGYYIHHRSAIFESSQQFGRIKGGSNFQSLYLQLHW